MGVDTRLLFYAQVVLRRPRTICDVGSCDGTEAFKFRRLRPGARLDFPTDPAPVRESVLR
jgi:hypothetical protein